MTTFSKFAASAGAAISSHVAELKPLLNVSYLNGTISLPPPTTAAALSIRQVRKFPKKSKRFRKIRYLRSRLAKHDFLALGETNVVPVILPPEINQALWQTTCTTVFGFLHLVCCQTRLRITVNALPRRRWIVWLQGGSNSGLVVQTNNGA